MAKFFNEEDLHTIFLDGFARGKSSGLFGTDAETNWQEYLVSNPTVFQKSASKPVVDIKPEDLVCPDCGGKMIERTNRQTGNKFWGCVAYPRCKGTRDSSGLSRYDREQAKEKEVEAGVNFTHMGVTWKK